MMAYKPVLSTPLKSPAIELYHAYRPASESALQYAAWPTRIKSTCLAGPPMGKAHQRIPVVRSQGGESLSVATQIADGRRDFLNRARLFGRKGGGHRRADTD